MNESTDIKVARMESQQTDMKDDLKDIKSAQTALGVKFDSLLASMRDSYATKTELQAVAIEIRQIRSNKNLINILVVIVTIIITTLVNFAFSSILHPAAPTTTKTSDSGIPSTSSPAVVVVPAAPSTTTQAAPSPQATPPASSAPSPTPQLNRPSSALGSLGL